MEVEHRKRPAMHRHPKQGDLFIGRESSFLSYTKRIETLLFVTGLEEVQLHGLGACIPKTMQIALAIQKKDKGIRVITNTMTVPLVDDITKNGETTSKIRHNSAICIRLLQPLK